MRAKLWKVRFENQNRRYWGDHDEVTINAPNAKCAMQKAISYFKGQRARRLQEITEVELLARQDN